MARWVTVHATATVLSYELRLGEPHQRLAGRCVGAVECAPMFISFFVWDEAPSNRNSKQVALLAH